MVPRYLTGQKMSHASHSSHGACLRPRARKRGGSLSPLVVLRSMKRGLALALLVLRVALVDDEDFALAPHDDVIRAALLDRCGNLHVNPPRTPTRAYRVAPMVAAHPRSFSQIPWLSSAFPMKTRRLSRGSSAPHGRCASISTRAPT